MDNSTSEASTTTSSPLTLRTSTSHHCPTFVASSAMGSSGQGRLECSVGIRWKLRRRPPREELPAIWLTSWFFASTLSGQASAAISSSTTMMPTSEKPGTNVRSAAPHQRGCNVSPVMSLTTIDIDFFRPAAAKLPRLPCLRIATCNTADDEYSCCTRGHLDFG